MPKTIAGRVSVPIAPATAANGAFTPEKLRTAIAKSSGGLAPTVGRISTSASHPAMAGQRMTTITEFVDS
jgi:hypothetical protein